MFGLVAWRLLDPDCFKFSPQQKNQQITDLQTDRQETHSSSLTDPIVAVRPCDAFRSVSPSVSFHNLLNSKYRLQFIEEINMYFSTKLSLPASIRSAGRRKVKASVPSGGSDFYSEFLFGRVGTSKVSWRRSSEGLKGSAGSWSNTSGTKGGSKVDLEWCWTRTAAGFRTNSLIMDSSILLKHQQCFSVLLLPEHHPMKTQWISWDLSQVSSVRKVKVMSRNYLTAFFLKHFSVSTDGRMMCYHRDVLQ